MAPFIYFHSSYYYCYYRYHYHYHYHYHYYHKHHVHATIRGYALSTERELVRFSR